MKRLPLSTLAAGAATALTTALALGITAATAVPVGFSPDRSADLAKQIDPNKPKSVILIIGDGMDDSMITAARDYSLGADGRFALDELPFTGAMTTHGLKVGAGPDYPVAYVSDSAPTASGWSTGKKTVDGRVSQGPSSASTEPGVDYETVLEKFKAAGKRTGNVSTAEITDATPAAAASHINARACQGPANLATCPTARKSVGGKGSIAEQLVDTKVDVLLGGGASRYAQTLEDGSQSVLDYAKSKRGYRSVDTSAGLSAISDLSGGPILGLFAGGNMTPKFQPLVAAPPPGAGSPTARCQAADRGTQPDLASMTKKAIELLDNPNGFFLQTESAMIDKQEHGMDICGAIGDLEMIDETVSVALDYQKAHPDTLVIVTGDHAHSTQIVSSVNGGRQTATLQTADGDPLTVAYSTGVGGSSHTGSQIRVAAVGPQAANVTGVIDQTDLFATMMGRTPSTLSNSGPTVTITAQPTPRPTAQPTAAPTASPTSQPSVKPIVQLAAPQRMSRRERAWIAVTASGATRVRVMIRQGSTRARRTLATGGGSLRLPALRRGKATITVVASAPAGRTKAKHTITVR